jgi:hypothetical protein
MSIKQSKEFACQPRGIDFSLEFPWFWNPCQPVVFFFLSPQIKIGDFVRLSRDDTKDGFVMDFLFNFWLLQNRLDIDWKSFDLKLDINWKSFDHKLDMDWKSFDLN